MSIVINIRDLIKYFFAFCILTLIAIYAIITIKGKEELQVKSALGMITGSSFLNCLKLEMPLFGIEDLQKEERKEKNKFGILEMQLAMLTNIRGSLEENSENETLENMGNEEISDQEYLE